MQVPYPFEEISHDDSYFFFLESLAAIFPLLDQFLEGSSSNELHLDQQVLIGLVKAVKFDDVFMVHGLKYFSFLEESSHS